MFITGLVEEEEFDINKLIRLIETPLMTNVFVIFN
jgi:hypothetical protein